MANVINVILDNLLRSKEERGDSFDRFHEWRFEKCRVLLMGSEHGITERKIYSHGQGIASFAGIMVSCNPIQPLSFLSCVTSPLFRWAKEE